MTVREFDIFLVAAPGFEPVLCDEARLKGFKRATASPGGVTIHGGWPDVWRANLWLRGAGRVIARIASFDADDLAALERRAGSVRWDDVLRADVPVAIDVTCRTSRIYHTGAAAERIARGLKARSNIRTAENAPVTLMVRIEDNVCTIGVDTSGELLHKRGFKTGTARAPLRETMAALFLRQCGFDGKSPVVDPMCGSGTFVIEAAEIAAGLNPGRARAFAFEHLATFDAAAWSAMRAVTRRLAPPAVRFYGSDRDDAAITQARANAERASVAALTTFATRPVADLVPPDGPTGLVMVNPPYGSRLSDKSKLVGLYRTLGDTLKSRFSGWRVGLVTAEKDLAYATALPFQPPGPPVAHGGIRVTLFQSPPL